MRNKIYISHANPEDNIFARWLALKLMAMGYEVWCDLIQLELGVDFWRTFENEIRTNTIRVLYVASTVAQSKDNVRRELAVAESTRKTLDINDKEKFIIALRIDPKLAFDNLHPLVILNNAADFAGSWADGLLLLTAQFEKDSIPRQNDKGHAEVKVWWDSLYATNKIVRQQRESYGSNWFTVRIYPKYLFDYGFKGATITQKDVESIAPPARMYKNRIITFASSQEVNHWLHSFKGTLTGKSYRIPVGRVVHGSYKSHFLPIKDAKNILIELLNKSCNMFLERSGLKKYEMANNREAYWVPLGDQKLPSFGKGQLIGVQKNKHWHFAISSSTKLYPRLIVSIRSHIVFTYGGKEVIPHASIQHRARRRQGRGWWNPHWRDKLENLMQILRGGGSTLVIPLSNDQSFTLQGSGIMFRSPISYELPSDEIVEPDTDLDWEEEDDAEEM